MQKCGMAHLDLSLTNAIGSGDVDGGFLHVTLLDLACARPPGIGESLMWLTCSSLLYLMTVLKVFMIPKFT